MGSDKEIVILDLGSIDSTLKIADAFKTNDPRIYTTNYIEFESSPF